SFKQRFINSKEQIYLEFIPTSTKSDAAILETYFICKLKPKFNIAANYQDKSNYKIKNKPEFSYTILCNDVSFIEIDKE
ncbi:unnamed protein product, partial [marine sediment metagenome]